MQFVNNFFIDLLLDLRVEIFKLFSIHEYLLLWGKLFIYQFTAFYGIILLRQLLDRLMKINDYKKFLFFVLFLFCR